MSDWSYVAVAYTIVWGGLAVYAVVLARRVFQAGVSERQLRALSAGVSRPDTAGEDAACDDGDRSSA